MRDGQCDTKYRNVRVEVDGLKFDSKGAKMKNRQIDDWVLPPDSRWIQTYTGRAFWPLNPTPDQLCVADIGHALAMKCRYTGHCREFYSVAQHSVIASRIVPQQDALWALLHDAAEAYLPDVARPVKHELVGFNEIEERLLRCVACRFNLPWPMPESVRRADLVLLATEQRDLMADPPYRWQSTEAIEPLAERIVPVSPEVAKEMFYCRFAQLYSE